SHLLAYSNKPDRYTLAAWINAGRHRHRARGAQLDEQAVLAAGDAGVPRIWATRAAGIQLGAVAGAGARSPVPSELHVRGLPRVVRVRHGMSWRHGALQPVAAVPHPQSGRADLRRGAAEQRRIR